MTTRSLGLIAVLALIQISCSFFKYPRNGIYLVPKGYTGEVIILFNQADGVDLEVEDGRYLYRIPGDGLLKLKSDGYTGIVSLDYYYVDENGRRESIKYLRITGDRDMYGKPKDKFDGQINPEQYEKGIFIMGAGGVGTSNIGGKIFSFTSFIVGTPKESNSLYDKMQYRITEIQREVYKAK